MKNSFVANAVNTTVQTVLSQCNTLGTSFNIYSQKDIFCGNVDAKIKEHHAYTRLQKASSFLFPFRDYCRRKNYNEYETGRYLHDSFYLEPYPEEVASNAYECTVLAIYTALKVRDGEQQVNRALVIMDRSSSASKRILHEFVIIGEVTGNETYMECPMDDFDKYAKRNLLLRSEPPWVVDAAFNIVCPLEQYTRVLGHTISSASQKAGLHQHGSGFQDKKRDQKPHTSYQVGPEISPMAFHALVSGGNLLAVEVTRKSRRLDVSENDGLLNYNDFLNT